MGNSGNNKNWKTFENLRIWQIAKELMLEVHGICKTLPRSEKFKLVDQAERSSEAVMDAIAEGYGTYYYKDKLKSFYLARRESVETQNHVRKMEGKHYISSEKAQDLVGRYQGLLKGINSYINYIKEKQKNEKKKS